MTTLPRDNDNMPIPALRILPGGAHIIDATNDGSTRNMIAFNPDTRIVSLYATGAVWVKFGDNSVTASATDHYYPAGLYYDFAIGGGKALHTGYLAVRGIEGECTVYVSEKG